MTPLPSPSFEDCAHSAQLVALIKTIITKQSGWINFAQFMHLALYAPHLGYYAAGRQKFGQGGDFVTAPEMSATFGQTLAKQIAQILQTLPNGDILELGAGTGKCAITILRCLDEKKCLPAHYYILEVSNHLRHVQMENCQKNLREHLFEKIIWLSDMPANIEGVVFGNEVLDALPVHIVHQTTLGIFERGIAIDGDEFVWQDKLLAKKAENSEYAPTPRLNVSEHQLLAFFKQQHLPDGYITECCPAASGLIKSLAKSLKKGVILLIDYGFSGAEYYHPQRNLGTLMCHYQHYAHTDPLANIGLQDITAHVDFTQIAQAGVDNGLTLHGFTSQAQFLMNCGILEYLQAISPENAMQYAPISAAIQKLLSPAEMGDLFKVIAFSQHYKEDLIGFARGDKSHTL